MGFDLTTLSQWKEERASAEDIILAPTLAVPGVEYMDVFNDVTGQIVAKPIISSDGTSKPGTGCNGVDTGDTKLKEFALSASAYYFRQNFCLQDLQRYFTKKWLNNSKKPTTLNVLDVLAGEISKKTALKNNAYIWLNNTSVATYPAEFKNFSGLLQTIDACIPSANVHTVATGKTLGTDNTASTEKITDVLDKIIFQLLPADAAYNTPVLFMGTDTFNILKNTLKKENLFHYSVEGQMTDAYMLRYPGSTAIVVATPGLNSNNISGQVLAQRQRIVATFAGNLALSLSFEDDVNAFTVDYSAYHKELFFDANFWLGAGVKFCDLVATSILS